MYRVKADGITIYDDAHLAEAFKAIGPKLTMKDNSAGSLEISLPPGNAGYKSVKRMESTIAVQRQSLVDGSYVEIWEGRVIQEKNDFWNNRVLTCEGELAYLNDTTQPPKEYSNFTVRNFLSALLTIHNDKMESAYLAGDQHARKKKFVIGAVTVVGASNDDNIYRVTNNDSTISTINTNLLEPLGGHLIIRKENGIRYLDYYQDFPNINGQEIRFGQNLLDFTRDWDMTQIATVVMPKGAKLDTPPVGYPPDLEVFLDVSSVNGGSRYVTNEQGIAKYGWLEVVVNWDDVTDPTVLKTRAQNYLSDVQFDEMMVEASAVDLRYLGIHSESIKLLDQVRCISAPHGMDRLFPVTELSIQLDKPDNSTYILGSKVTNSFTSSQKSVNQAILDRLDKIPPVDVEGILESARDNANQLINQVTNGYITIQKTTTSSGVHTEALIVSNNASYETSTRCWKWTVGGLGYFTRTNTSQAWSSPIVAIDMSGQIVADRILTGTLSTIFIKSVDGNSQWNLSNSYLAGLAPGEFRMKRGSITLGTGYAPPSWANGGRFYAGDDGSIYAEYGKIGGFTLDYSSIYNDVIRLDSRGMTMSEGGNDLGYFGTQYWTGYPSHKGITMSLEYNSSPRYIVWSNMDYSSDSYYTVKFGYAARQVGPSSTGMRADRIHFGCNMNGNGWLAENFWIDPNTGGANGGWDQGSTILYIPAGIGSGGTVTSYYRARVRGGFLIPY